MFISENNSFSWNDRIKNFDNKKLRTRLTNAGAVCFCLGVILGISSIIVAACGINGPELGVYPASMLVSGLGIGSLGFLLLAASVPFPSAPKIPEHELTSLQTTKARTES